MIRNLIRYTHFNTKSLRSVAGRFSLSTGSQALPFFIWLGESSSPSKRNLLVPEQRVMAPKSVADSQDVLDLVNTHYENDHFVGGMGESDPGVWFVSFDSDALDHATMIQESIEAVKIERHGVPFGLYTAGLTESDVPLAEIGVDTVEVSLFAGSPGDYEKATGLDASSFGRVCGFIADSAEQGVSVNVGVLSNYASAGRDLAVSLGAQEVHIYE